MTSVILESNFSSLRDEPNYVVMIIILPNFYVLRPQYEVPSTFIDQLVHIILANVKALFHVSYLFSCLLNLEMFFPEPI